MYINGEYTQVGAGYSPKLIDDKPFDDVYNQLMSGQANDATTAISAEAANITKLICSAQWRATRGSVQTVDATQRRQSNLGLLAQIRLALAIAFHPRYAYVLSAVGALAMLGLLTWTGGFLNYYPTSGWDFYADTQETVTILVLAVLFGLLVPLQVAAVTKARSAVATAGGLFGTIFGVLSMSCCAPLTCRRSSVLSASRA